jgi:hypothetical protein
MATSIVSIPTSEGAAYYSQRVRLDGRDYNLRFAWNEREGRWYLSIFTDEDVPLILGIKIVTNWPLLRYYRSDPRVPPGEIMAMDLTPDGAPPGFDELAIGKRVELVYFAVVEE